MSEIVVVYWSGTGNTEAMAGFVGQGIKEGGKEAKVVSVSDITPDALKDCPVFVEAVKGFASGKTIGLFGSYGWGDGEWMRTWVADMESAGARVLGGEDAICQEAPNEEAQEACIDLGKDLAKA